MPQPDVSIELVRNGLGLVIETTDNVVGLIAPGVAVANKMVLGTPYAIYSTTGAAAIGIDAVNNAAAFKQVSEFYAVAGEGKKMWLMLVASTKKLSEAVDIALPVCPAKELRNAAQGEICVIGVMAGTGANVALDGLDSDVYTAMTKAQVLADDSVNKMMPLVFIVEGRGMTNSAALRDLSEEDKYRTAVMLGCSKSDGIASVGLLLGQIAALPVQRKVSRVKNGILPIDNAYLTDTVSVKTREDLDTIYDKRYIGFRNFPNRAGFYFNGDLTATAATDDLNIIARIRTIDKATKIAYNTYVEEIDDDVELNDDGTLNPSVAVYLKTKIEKAVKDAMVGEISNFIATVDTTVDVSAGEKQLVYLDIYPRGYLNGIRVILGFKNN